MKRATPSSKVLSTRVPWELALKVEADAAALNKTPAELLRDILGGRYALRPIPRIASNDAHRSGNGLEWRTIDE